MSNNRKLDHEYLKTRDASQFDILMVNSDSNLEYISANAFISSVSVNTPSDPIIHPFLFGGM